MSFGSADWAQVKALFQSLLDLEPSARPEFLNRQEISPELRLQLAGLLQAHEEAGSFLNPQGALAGIPAPVSAARHSRIQAGTLLAERFQVIRFVARGGMGEVYEAEDLELRMRVAIKTIRPEIADYPGTLSRFRREVHLAKRVTHPNVCRIFDIFRHRDPAAGDVVFLSMELLTGQTLAERIRDTGPLPEADAKAVLRQVASALEAAHTAGILHRDLKPGNILLEAGAGGGMRAVITDFGMAWSGDARSGAAMTASGPLAFGTPEYMSPEQIEGKELTPASDIYSLGLVSYQAVTGVRAFDADTPLFSALRRLNEQPPTPSQVLPQLDRRWDNLIARCLHRDPARRFSSATEFATALDTHDRRAPLLRVPRSITATRSWLAFHRWLVLSLVATLIVLAVGASFLFWRGRKQPADALPVTLVLADFVNTTGEPAFDNALNVALAAKLQQTPYLTLMPEQKIHLGLRYMGLPAHERLTEEVARQVCEREAGQVVLQGFISTSAKGYIIGLRASQCHTGELIAVKQFPVEFRDSVLDALDQAADAIRPSLGESRESILKYDVPLGEATTSSVEAVTAFAQGTQAWNEKGEAAALPYFRRATEIDPNFAMAYARLGTVYGNMGETQRANEAMRQAFDRRDRVTEWERYYIVSHYYGFVTGEVDKEMQTYEEWARAYPHDMAWTINLSVDLAFTGQYDKAIELQRRAIREIPGLSPSYGNLAQLYLAIDRPDEARSVLDQAEQLNLQDVNIQLDEYELAFYRDDKATMSKLLTGASRFPGVEDTLLAQQAATEDRSGRVSAGAQLAVKAAAVAARAGSAETSANWLAGEAVRQAEMGRQAQARQLAAKALSNPAAARGSDVQSQVALAAAQYGDIKRAQSLLAELTAAHPLDTLIRSYWAPVIRARIAYAQGHDAQAIDALNGTDAYDLGIFTPGQCMDAAYIRGQALLRERKGVEAAAAFRHVLEHRGLVLNSPTLAMAQLGLARALAQSGDAAGSRTAYQDLFAFWKDADSGFVLYRQAQAEYRALH